MMGEVAQIIPSVYTTLDNHQLDHCASIIEMEGKLKYKFVPILIDISSNYRNFNPELVEEFRLDKEFHREPQLVQLTTGTRRRISHKVKSCAFELNRIPTTSH